MPKIINTFLKGKLNKDLDARLIPNGEYRDARNVQVSKSEGPNVGSLENVLGNEEVVNLQTLTGQANVACIGSLADETNNCVYLFVTNYTDPNPSKLTYSVSAKNFIIRYDAFNDTATILVKGNFLNFSKTHQITAVNLLEDLLFWSDNRNQPRKINVQTALSVGTSHYTNEDQISVSKYNPYQSIQLYQESALSPGNYETTMKDVTSKFLPTGGTALVNDAGGYPGGTTQVAIDNLNANFPVPNQPISYINNGVMTSTNRIVVTATTTLLTASGNLPAMDDNTELVFEPNPYYDNTFAGDPDYLEDRFVRFSYRFRFEDNEYSLLAPFTQIAFIPKQDGYFMYIKDDNTNYEVTDQSSTYRSTIVSFMENKIDEIKLYIPLPFSKTTLQSNLKVKEMDILYKESDGLSVKVVDTISINEISSQAGNADFYTYNYISKKPIKTLPSNELTRTYDKIPVRALAQEVSSNRIIYGNYQTKHTPPAAIDYNVAVSDKFSFELSIATTTTTSAVNSETVPVASVSGINIGDFVTGTGITSERTVIGIAGSNVILNASVNVGNNVTLTFTPAPDEQTTSIVEYPNSSVKQNRNYQVGVVLADRFGRQSSVILSNNTTLSTLGNSSFIGDTIYSAYFGEAATQGSWPGNSIKMLFNNPIGPTSPNRVTLWPGLYNGDSSSAAYNPLGWYSYKIVVKQTEQEYYNVYLPGIMASYPNNTTLEVGSTSHASLINDNINKVPRDLTEVGPDQKQFRSSVRLFGRVQNTATAPTYVASKTTFDNLGSLNIQYYPGRSSDTVSTISTIRDLFDYNPSDPPRPNLFPQFYLLDSNPLIARISTDSKIGQIASTNYAVASGLNVTAASYPANTNITLKNIEGTVAADMIVSSSGLPEGIYVTQSGNPIQLSEDVTLTADQVLTFVPGFPNPNQGEDKIPGIQFLSVYETEPVESALDIYWETSTSGLLSDLNNAILNSNSGGAAFSSFDVGGWNEGLASGDNILSGNFTIVDNFGVNIPTGNITSLIMTSVVDNNGADRSSYFTLTNPSAGFFNIKTTSDYYDNIFFSDSSAVRLFTFSFQGVVTNSGVATTTSYVQGPFGPANVQPVITLPASASTIVNTSRITTSTLQTLEGHNGANNDDLKTSDLTAEITAVQDTTNSINVLSENYFNLATSVIGNPTYRLRGLLTKPSTTLPVANYTVVITYEDAIETASHTVTVNMNSTTYLQATYPQLIYRTCSDQGQAAVPYAIFQISNHPITANNGYYVYSNGTTLDGGSVLNPITSNDGLNDIITIDRTNAVTTSGSGGQVNTFFFSAASWSAVLSIAAGGTGGCGDNGVGNLGWCGAPGEADGCNVNSSSPPPGTISIPNTLIEIV